MQAGQLERLALLVALVCATPVGVTAVRDPAEAAARHVLDALAGLPAVDAAPAGPLADVGSGGGLPGLVLAIVRPEREVHLIEATARKATFIAETAAELGLAVARARGALGGARARAPARRLRLRRRARPRPAAGRRRAVPAALPRRAGAWCSGRASRRRTELALAAGALAGAILAPGAPGVLVLGKLAATPERFPRRPGMAAKRPLACGLIRPTAPVES